MPPERNRYLHLGLVGGAIVLLIAGLVLFVAAVSFEGYIAALMVMALAGCSYAGAREVKARQARTPEPREEA
ncbi:MAG TPA: hypothetical protein VFK84_09035 [Burkholderiales bacterium]|nr:hypothetical protein [Burkholderiales bacterium]